MSVSRPGCFQLPKQVEHPGGLLEVGHAVTRSNGLDVRAAPPGRARASPAVRLPEQQVLAVITSDAGGDSVLAAEHDDLALDEEPVRLGTGEVRSFAWPPRAAAR